MVTAALAFASNTSAATFLTPSTVKAGDVQAFTLAIQPDPAKSGRNIPVERVELFVPAGFTIDSFAPTPEWEQDWTIQSVQKATWSREAEALENEHEREEFSEHDAVFQFLGHAAAAGKYTFTIRQTYTDGTVVQWGPAVGWPGGPKTTAGPGPAITVGWSAAGDTGGDSSTLSIVALVLAALALVVGAAALLRSRRT